MSVPPISLFRYFSENGSVNGNTIIQQKLTQPSLSDLFGCNSENVENLRHYFYDYIHHFLVKRGFQVGVNFQSLEKSFDALEDLKKSILSRTNILGCLRVVRITMDRTKVSRRIHTKRRTPIPAKIAF